MPPITTLHLPHLPPHLTIHIALYTTLHNAPALRSHILAGNPTFAYALIDARTLLSTTHLLAAIFRACNDHLHSRLKTRNVHSEIVFSLGSNNNIAQNLRAFGIQDGTTEMVVVKVGFEGEGVTGEEVERYLEEVVEGRGVEWCDETVRGMADLGMVRRLYKLPSAGGSGEGKGKRRRKDGSEEGSGEVARVERGEEWERKELEVAVLGLMALRGAN